MIERELVVVGGGPAGLSSAIAAAESGAHVLVIDRAPILGGQLVKQTHKFFGSEQQYAKTRGFDIAKILIEKAAAFGDRIETWTEATVVALYPDRVLTVTRGGKYLKIHAGAIVVASGASERFLSFENNDLPGVYGAGAVQTLMNVYGVKPADRVLMVGSGNIGLIVSYQLMQAGVEIAAIVEASPKIGGYKVHASKVARLGVPILTSTSILRAEGDGRVKRAVTVSLDGAWNPIPGTEKTYEVDAVCVAVGLSPLATLLSMAGAMTHYIPEFGGHAPILTDEHESTIDSVFVAGDAAGVEEASSAMVAGRLAGLCAAKRLGHSSPDHDAKVADCHAQLQSLRNGPFGCKTCAGLAKMREVRDHA
ncbi:MAG: NAD(P)/FAD-dependent oxidoreductase [Candidatus Izemoplasmatales bacterium]